LSDLSFEAGRIDEARRYAQQGVALDPLSVGLRESLGKALEAAARFDDAEAQYQRAVEIEPSDPAALMALAKFEAYVRDRMAVAVTLQEKAVRLAPDQAFLAGELVGLYMDLGDDARAAELLDAATNRWPDRTNVNVMGTLLSIYRGDRLSAGRYATKVLETSPTHMAGIYYVVTAALARGDLAAARAQFAFACPEFLAAVPPEITSENVGKAILAASILLASPEDRGRARVLLDRAERVIRTIPRLGANGFGIADVEIHALRGEKSEAIRALQAAVKSGWRGPIWRAELEHNHMLAPLQGDPGFEAAVAAIRRDMAKQRAELAAQARDGS